MRVDGPCDLADSSNITRALKRIVPAKLAKRLTSGIAAARKIAEHEEQHVTAKIHNSSPYSEPTLREEAYRNRSV